MAFSKEALSILRDSHNVSKSKGWYDTLRTDKQLYLLMISEVAEALEEVRNNRPNYYENENGKPEGLATELADVLIRLFDFIYYKKLDEVVMIEDYLYDSSPNKIHREDDFNVDNLLDSLFDLNELITDLNKHHVGTSDYIEQLEQIFFLIYDISEQHDLKIDEVVIKKYEYNKTRSYRHGNKVL